MDLSWQDSVGSFLDTLATDPSSSLASFVDAVGAALWSAPSDTASPSGAGSLLWSDGTSDDTNTVNFGTGELTSWAPESALPAAGLLWSDTSGNAVWSGKGAWAAENGMLTTTGFADGSLSQGAGTVSPLWQAVLSDFAGASGEIAPLFANVVNDISQVLWTATGGAGQPPMMSLTPEPQLTSFAGFGALAQTLFSTLAPQQLLWTAQSGVAGLAPDPMIGAAATPPLMGGAGILTQNPAGAPISGAGVRP
jgi:hypothetical protein